jgi:uncharacterized protein YkwD
MLRLTAVLSIGLLFGTAAAASAPAVSPAMAVETPQQAVIRITNEPRAVNGRPGLRTEGSLNRMAQQWAEKMSADNRMYHSTNAWRMSKANKGFTLCCGENIAYGYGGAGTVVKAWMASAGHRANILDSRYTHMGAGYAAKGNFWVQVFAAYPKVRTASYTPRFFEDSWTGTAVVSRTRSAARRRPSTR